ncbi:Aste57867_12011 [Aphanomyces stellatus]|uniref:Aste57867_12011 protein n=1 Tax=Aphanomyces stellatus TaxID=120398 RepID=A0A485KVP0_9STRA|nr:hypothetical protein As57867_011966 [Aphanomyces stellatus]VFT88866.1 Aste57867_12011 [Aphanomyces stellatus]
MKLLFASLISALVSVTTADPPYLLFANPHHNESIEQKVFLDPTVQHTPLAFAQSELRPPLPRVPSSFDILVTIANYRDGVRCGYTVWTAFARAAHPDRVHVGVVDQTHGDDAICIDEYCKLAHASWPDDECKYRDQIQVDALDAKDSKGPAVARARQRAFIDGQEFCMAIDAHTQYIYNWDVTIVDEWTRTQNEMAVLTIYPLSYAHLGPNFTLPTNGISRHLCMYGKRERQDDIPILWPTFIYNSDLPQLQAFWGGGLSFSKCHAETRSPIDGHLKWVFMGEEYVRAMQLWTHGYDLYSPSVRGSVLFHNYTDDGTKKNFFENAEANDAKPLEEVRGYNRLRAALKFPFVGEVDARDMETYYGNPVRTLDEYLKFSKISNVDPQHLDDWPCDQLHWVPYAVPEVIEELLPGYHMLTTWSEADARAHPKAAASGQDAAAERLFVALEEKLQELEDGDASSIDALRAVVDDVKTRLAASHANIQALGTKLDSLVSNDAAKLKQAQDASVTATTSMGQREADLQSQLDVLVTSQRDAMHATLAVGGVLMVLVVLGFALTRPKRSSQPYAPVECEPPTPFA